MKTIATLQTIDTRKLSAVTGGSQNGFFEAQRLGARQKLIDEGKIPADDK